MRRMLCIWVPTALMVVGACPAWPDSSGDNKPVIVSAVADFTVVPAQMTIGGRNFGAAKPVVTLDGLPLTVVSFTNASVSAFLPNNLKPGSYLLVLTDGQESDNTAQLDATLGTTGPKGDKGDPGPAGPQGATGPQGIPGVAGVSGSSEIFVKRVANSAISGTDFVPLSLTVPAGSYWVVATLPFVLDPANLVTCQFNFGSSEGSIALLGGSVITENRATLMLQDATVFTAATNLIQVSCHQSESSVGVGHAILVAAQVSTIH